MRACASEPPAVIVRVCVLLRTNLHEVVGCGPRLSLTLLCGRCPRCEPIGDVEQLEAAVRLDPKLGRAWQDLGSALRSEGERERALDAYEHSLELVAMPTEER